MSTPATGDFLRFAAAVHPTGELRKQRAHHRKLAQYKATLDAGADPAQVSTWINEAQQERTRLEAELRAIPHSEPITQAEIAETLTRARDLTQTIITADPLDKADLYQQLGLKLTCYPQKQLVEARVIPEPPHVRSGRVRGWRRTKRTCLRPQQVVPAGGQVINLLYRRGGR